MKNLRIKIDKNNSYFDGLKIGAEFTITKESGFSRKAWWFNLHLIWWTLTVHYIKRRNNGI